LDFFTLWYQSPLFNRYDNHPKFLIDLEKKKNKSFTYWQKSLEILSPALSSKSFEENIAFLENIINNNDTQLTLVVGSLDQKYLSLYQEANEILQKKAMLLITENAAHNIHKTHPQKIIEIANKVLKDL
jgi:hypothetical protein